MGLIRKNKETGQLLGQDWFDHQADTGRFRQFGIDKKLKKLRPWFQTLTAGLQESIRSINRARNILAHHEGFWVAPDPELGITETVDGVPAPEVTVQAPSCCQPLLDPDTSTACR